MSQLAAIGTVAFHGEALIELARTDARPLLGAGAILMTAALRFQPRHLLEAAKALALWRRGK